MTGRSAAHARARGHLLVARPRRARLQLVARPGGRAGEVAIAGIKFPWFVFFQKDSGLRPPEPPATMR